MKLKRLKALTLVLLAWTTMSQAAGTVATHSSSASMEVGLRIVDACAIQTSPSTGASVECKEGSPYSIQAAPSGATAAAPVITVAF
ncbi:hypothetical protein [Massilia sp. 9096]|uniref:hypothetical protein n=1 Tax=Massilia sp. 9096 TaxID=1500894 RepID=UPI00055BE04D|nr:hypothetical protein [Massilia sp. 9096]